MKYSLRTLLIVAILGPPLLAGAFLLFGLAREFLSILTPFEWALAALAGALVMVPLTICVWALVTLGNRKELDRDTLLSRQVALDLVIFALFVVLVIPAIVAAILTLQWWWPF